MIPRRRLSEAFLFEICREFNAHTAADWPPLRAIAVAHGVGYWTAARWVGMCRRRGMHLEPATGMRHHYADGTLHGGEQR